MGKGETDQEAKKAKEPKIGEPGYLNKNCWLVGNLKANPYKRCQYCESRFRDCLFLQYQAISTFLIVFFIILSSFIKGKIPEIELVLLIIFSFVIIYGYFFNKSTDRLIQSYFAQRKAKEALEELTEKLEEKVEEQTKEIREAFKKVNELSRWKSELLSVVAHQIKNPLAVIKGYSSLVEDRTINDFPTARGTFIKIKSAANKLIDLLNNLLDLDHIEDGKMHYEFNEIELNKLLKETVNDFQFLAQQKQLELIFEPAASEPRVKGDSYKLSQVFRNLIDNAIKYTEKGWVKINLQLTTNDQQQESVLIKVEDSGIGISKESLPTLFDQFIRAKETRTIKGTGLGLYIAKQIVKAHQGEIWAESEGEGKGTRFYVRLNPHT